MTTMKSMPVTEFKAHCLELFNEVAATGEPILVTKRGKPTAMVCAPPKEEKQGFRLGLFEGTGTILEDLLPPFDEPWDELL
jgi:prevent-host-death family protein